MEALGSGQGVEEDKREWPGRRRRFDTIEDLGWEFEQLVCFFLDGWVGGGWEADGQVVLGERCGDGHGEVRIGGLRTVSF